MKKLMIVLVLFMSIGLFATANNGKIWKGKKSIGELTAKTFLKNKHVGSWLYTYSCGGHTYTGCCWETSAQAYAHGTVDSFYSCNSL